MKIIVILLLIVATASSASAQSSTPETKILGPYVLKQQKSTHLYSGLTNTLFVSVTKFVGDYRLDFFVGGEKTNFSENDPTIKVTPVLGKDEGKTGILKVSVKKPGQHSFAVIREDTFKIEPPPLFAVAEGDLEEGDPLLIKAWLGTMDNPIELPKGLQMEAVPGFFDGGVANITDKGTMENGGDSFFGGDKRNDSHHTIATGAEPATTGHHFFFDFMPSQQQTKVVQKMGKELNVTVIDPLTGQARTFQVAVYPKRMGVESDAPEK